MNSSVLRWAVLIVVATFGIKVFAHARVKPTGMLVPRSNNAGVKVAPCGGFAKVANPPTYAPGTVIQIDWEETINHPGQYEFYFSDNADIAFAVTPLKVVVDNQDAAVVGGNFHQYSTTITLPADKTCANCTLQMIQVMTDSNPPTYYYSCVDLKLQAGAPAPTPTPTPAPGPAPTPSPAPNCH